MDVYEFNKCLLDRLEESLNVLSRDEGVFPASQVHREWACYIELQIEPTGWQAIWKIPRVICEELNLRFPTTVLGYIEQVIFGELKAIFVVQAVQDEDVHLPEKHEVRLQDLWVTRSQENGELNVERTADCLDRLRFFYMHVWMPWDNDTDDDVNWVEKHLESRIRLCYDLRKRCIKRALAAHIRTLISEAKYIEQRREYLESGLSDEEQLNESLNESHAVTDLMRMHLRLTMIRSEFEMLENPETRRVYESIKFDGEKCLKFDNDQVKSKEKVQDKQTERCCYVITKASTFKRQLELLRMAEELGPKNVLVQISPSLQDVLSACDASDQIFVSPGRHTIKFLEYLNDNGSLCGLMDNKYTDDASDQISPSEQVIIMSRDDDSILLMIDGDFTLENLVLDCQNIHTGVVAKNGHIRMRNCRLIGSGKSSTQEGILCSGNSSVTLENCIIENFGIGIVMQPGTMLSLNNSKILNCKIGLDMNPINALVHFKNASIRDASKCGIYVDSLNLDNSNPKCIVLQHLNQLKDHSKADAPWTGECNFEDCRTNISILNAAKSLLQEKTISIYGDQVDRKDGNKAVACSS